MANNNIPGSNIIQIDPEKYRESLANLKRIGIPCFTVDDLRTSQHTLVQILRYICIRDGLSKEAIKELHSKLALETYMPTNKITSDFSNLSRLILLPTITWDSFMKFIMVAGYSITDVTFQLTKRDTGEQITVSKSDIARLIEENPVPMHQPNTVIK